MKPIRTDEGVIALVRQYAPTRACERAIDEGNWNVIKDPAFFGWRVYVETINKCWAFTVICDEINRKYKVITCV